MLVRQRQASILEEINRLGGARIADLGPSFGVSDVTARRDIDALAGQGLVARVRGGAVAVTVLVTDSGLGEQARTVLRERIGDRIAVDVAAGPDTAPPDPCRHRPGRARPTVPYAAR